MRSVDALIVGGGPAGLAAGIVLGRAGLRVVLCERQSFPVDKVCGEGLMPTGVAYLQELGVAVGERFSFSGVRYLAPDGSSAAAPFREGPGWGVRRTVLSDALLARARQVTSLCVRQNTEVTLTFVDERGVEALAGNEPLRARLVVGADGLRSVVRRWAGLGSMRRRHWRWGARQHFALRPWSEYVEVSWSECGVEAYVTPVGSCQVGVAFLWHRGRYKDLQGGDGLIGSLVAAFPALREQLRDAPTLGPARAVGPLQQQVKGVVADGVLLIGDAAGYLDAITGEGLSLALAQALALETTVVPALQDGTGLVRRQALERYQKVSSRLARATARVAELALLLSRFPPLCRRAVRALRSDPRLFQELLSANMGLQPVYRLQTLARLGWGLSGLSWRA